MKIGNKKIDLGAHTYVMGILNVTPDSFSDGGRFDQIDHALKHVEAMILDGVDIIDVGGESTRPGYVQISDQEEIDRVCPVLEAIKGNFDIPLSLDTYKSHVAEAGLLAGADLINDIWGLQYDPEMAPLIARTGVPAVLMHNRTDPAYTDFRKDLVEDFKHILKTAKEAGIRKEQIILDPGVGFAKNYEENLLAMKYMTDLKQFDLPILLGVSRKSVIGNTLHVPSDQREAGTIATSVFAAMNGIDFVRVHEVKGNKEAILMTEAIINA